MSSSVYTTTDTSPPNTPLNSRQQSRKPRRSGITPKRSGARASQTTIDMEDDEDMETVHSDGGEGDSDEADPTPLIQRLRPRTKSFAASEHHSEADADGEDEATEDEDENSLFSPGPSSRLRSRDNTESDIPMSADESGPRQSVGRSAKTKSRQGHENGDAGTGMEVDETMTAARGVAHKRQTRRNSRLLPSPDPTDDEAPASAITSALSSPPASNDSISTISEETETEAVRTTRSGKAFGTWQSRRRRLRQEAIDDPDMDVEDDDEVPESDEEEEDSFEAGKFCHVQHTMSHLADRSRRRSVGRYDLVVDTIPTGRAGTDV